MEECALRLGEAEDSSGGGAGLCWRTVRTGEDQFRLHVPCILHLLSKVKTQGWRPHLLSEGGHGGQAETGRPREPGEGARREVLLFSRFFQSLACVHCGFERRGVRSSV